MQPEKETPLNTILPMDGNRLNGNVINNRTIDKIISKLYRFKLENKELFTAMRVVIYLVEGGDIPLDRQYASQVSARAKRKSFMSVPGVEFILRTIKLDSTSTELVEKARDELSHNLREDAIDLSVKGIIIQMPIDSRLFPIVRDYLPMGKDIDSIIHSDLFPVCATAEACLRLHDKINPGNIERRPVAVIGSEGFVGHSIVEGLLERGFGNKYSLRTFDIEDDLSELEELKEQGYLIIISAASNRNIILPEYLTGKSRVIDAGYIPFKDNDDSIVYKADGNLSKEAYSIPEFITPVPGGIGPLEMSILLERFYWLVTGESAGNTWEE